MDSLLAPQDQCDEMELNSLLTKLSHYFALFRFPLGILPTLIIDPQCHNLREIRSRYLSMKPSIPFRAIVFVFTALVLGACATKRPVMEWRDEGYSTALNNILVIAAIERSTRRRVYEDEFVEALEAFKVKATPSYELMTSSMTVSRETVEAAIKGQNIDAVLVTRLLGVKEEEIYRPPTYYDHHGSYHRYYTHALQSDNRAYYRRFKVLTLETNIYDAATQELVWSMQSESLEPSTPRNLIEEQIALTIRTLQARGLIVAKD